MNSEEKIFLVLFGLAIVSLYLFFRTLKKGRQEAKKHQRSRNSSRRDYLPPKLTTNSIMRAAKYFNKQLNTELAFDTNILIDYPTILKDIAKRLAYP